MATNVLPGDTTTPAGVAKVITYIALAAVAVLIPALSDDQLSLVEIINTVIAAVGAIGVYWATANGYVKTIVAFGLAALQALVLIVADGSGLGDVSIANWLAVAVAAFAAIGVAIVPNKPVEPTYEPRHAIINTYVSSDEEPTIAL